MKKTILKVGKKLSKSELKTITGGLEDFRSPDFCDEHVTEISRKECLCLYFGICNDEI